MSRIAKAPVSIPAGVEITIDGQNIKAKGAKGTLELDLNEQVSISKEDNVLQRR